VTTTDPSVNAIETTGLRKVFGHREVVRGLDIVVPCGAVYGFLGQNGAGKTTTLRMLMGLFHPSGGTISLLGETVFEGSRRDDAAWLRVAPQIGALIEGPSFYPYLSGRRNLQLFGALSGVQSCRERCEVCLELVGLGIRGDDLFGVYSRGMKQRLGIAAALLAEPRMVVLDEPLNGLDPPAVIMVRDILRGLAEGGCTVILSSHLLNDAEQLCSHVGILHEGRMVAQGPLEVLCRSERELVDLRVSDQALSLRLLTGHESVSRCVTTPQGLSLELLPGSAGAISRTLVEGGVELLALIPRRRSLEGLFLSETGQENRP